MKLLRSILLVLFLFLCTTAVAQMDNDGNFHWDELYTPDEILELDMSLPNKVEVSKIKNRERVKYVKLKCYPWIEHIPFTPEDFPNIEALRIESFLIQGLNGIDGFKKIKRLEVTDVEGHSYARNFLRTNLPCVTNPVWEMSWLEELRIKGIDILVTENSISKLRSVKCLNINTFNEFYGCNFFDEFEKLTSLRQIYFGQDNVEMTLYLAKIFSEKGVDVVGAFDVDKISSIIVTKDENSYTNDVEWEEIIRYRPWVWDNYFGLIVDDPDNQCITMYVKKENGRIALIKTKNRIHHSAKNIHYYKFLNYEKSEDDAKIIREKSSSEEESSYWGYDDYYNSFGNDTLYMKRYYTSDKIFETYLISDTIMYQHVYDTDVKKSRGFLTCYSLCENKSVKIDVIENEIEDAYVEFDYDRNILFDFECEKCGCKAFMIQNNRVVMEQGAKDICVGGMGESECFDDETETFKFFRTSDKADDMQKLELLINNRDSVRKTYQQKFTHLLEFLKDRELEYFEMDNIFEIK